MVEEIIDEARAALRESLSEREVPEGIYTLDFGPDPVITTRVLRSLDGRSWTLREFDDFIDLGLHPQGSSSPGDAT